MNESRFRQVFMRSNCAALVGAVLLWTLTAIPIWGQESDKPAKDKAASPQSNYELRSNFEVGGTWVDIRGSEDKYQSDVNVRQGLQLANFHFDLRPVQGKSSWFDVATLRGQGFGGVEPFENLYFNMKKNGRFNFRFGYSKDNYYFNIPGFALGLHSDDNLRRNLHVDLDVYLHRTFKLQFGYGQINRSGNSFSSVEIFQDVFRLLMFNRSQTSNYRMGFEWRPGPFAVIFEQGFRSFRYDNQLRNVTDNQRGTDPSGLIRLNSYRQDLPTRDFAPISQVTVKYRPADNFDMVGRYEYSKGNIDFTRSDLQSLRIGAGNMSLERLALTQAVTRQPQHRADFQVSWFPIPRLGLHNSSNYNRYHLFSDALTNDIFHQPGAPGNLSVLSNADEYTRYTRVANETSLDFELNRIFTANAGYRYTERELSFKSDSEETNSRNSTVLESAVFGLTGSAGTRWQGTIEFEHGWANNQLLRIEPRKFNRWTGRGSFKAGAKLELSGSLGIRDDDNDTAGAKHEFDNREFSLLARWTPKSDYLLELGYGRMDILSATDILFFLMGPEKGISRYITNTNYCNVFLQVPLHKRLRAQLGYRLLDDSAGSYPLVFHQADAGLSLRIHTSVWLNLGWKYYAYNEEKSAQQDYAGNLLSLSLRFGF